MRRHFITPLIFGFCVVLAWSVTAQTNDGVPLLTGFSERDEEQRRAEVVLAADKLRKAQEMYQQLLQTPAGVGEEKTGKEWDKNAKQESAALLQQDPKYVAFLRREVVDAGCEKLRSERRLFEVQRLNLIGSLNAQLQQIDSLSERLETLKQIRVISKQIEKNALLARQDQQLAYLDRYYIHDPNDRMKVDLTLAARGGIGAGELWYFGSRRLPTEWQWIRQHRQLRTQHRWLERRDRSWSANAAGTGASIVLLDQRQRLLTTLDGLWEELYADPTSIVPVGEESFAGAVERRWNEKLRTVFGDNLPPEGLIKKTLEETGFQKGLQAIEKAAQSAPDEAAKLANIKLAAAEQRRPLAILTKTGADELAVAKMRPSAQVYTQRLKEIAAEKDSLTALIEQATERTEIKRLQSQMGELSRERDFIDKMMGSASWRRTGMHNLSVMFRYGLGAVDIAMTVHGVVEIANDLSLYFGFSGSESIAEEQAASSTYAQIVHDYQGEDSGLARFWELDETLRVPWIVYKFSSLGSEQLRIAERERDISATLAELPDGGQTTPGLIVEVPALLDPDHYLEELH